MKFRSMWIKLLCLFTLLSSLNKLYSQSTSGVIWFKDGTTQEFKKVKGIGKCAEAFSSYGDNGDASKGLYVDYKNSVRLIPFEKMKVIKIEDCALDGDNCIKNVTFDITTTTRVEVTSTKYFAWGFWFVVQDELTDEQKDISYSFAEGRKMKIDRIEFYSSQRKGE